MRPWTLRSGGSHREAIENGGSSMDFSWIFHGSFMDFMRKNEGKMRSRPDSFGDLNKEKVISMEISPRDIASQWPL